MKPWIVGTIGFVLGVATCVFGLILIAILGLQAEPAFVDYSAAAQPTDIQPSAEMYSHMSPTQQAAVEKAYQAIDKVDKAAEYR